MSLDGELRQMSGQPELAREVGGEAAHDPRSGEAPPATQGSEHSGSDHLMEQVVERSNVVAALRHVQQHRGSPGIDGMTVQALSGYLKQHWVEIRAQRLRGTYRPQPVRRVTIPKPGGGERQLGIPTVLDRFIQQAILHVLQPRFDPTFSAHSCGFRPGRSAHGAIREAQRYIQEGRRWVVDVDSEKFFDRVNHDVRSRRAGERVLQMLRRLYGTLRLRLNEEKSAVAKPQHRKVLGYSVWYAKGGVVKRRVAPTALKGMKDRIRQITSRSGGRSLEAVAGELRDYLTGWREYFRFAETPGIFRGLDEWIRHRLRALQLKQWKRGRTAYRELRARGLSVDLAAQVAANTRRWWRNAGLAIHMALPASL